MDVVVVIVVVGVVDEIRVAVVAVVVVVVLNQGLNLNEVHFEKNYIFNIVEVDI